MKRHHGLWILPASMLIIGTWLFYWVPYLMRMGVL